MSKLKRCTGQERNTLFTPEGAAHQGPGSIHRERFRRLPQGQARENQRDQQIVEPGSIHSEQAEG